MSHKIESGETLSGLAARFHTTVSALARANHIQNANLIRAGERLKIPTSKSTSFTQHDGKKTKGSDSTGGTDSLTGIHGAAALARAGYAAAMHMGGYHSLGLCATGVSRAIASAYGISVHGNGNQIDDNLPRSKFKQVNISLAQALKIPGCVLTWEHTSTALGAKYGHTAITAGDGHTSYSDFIERDTLAGGRSRSGLKIFIPR